MSIDPVEFLRRISAIAKTDDGADRLAETLAETLHDLWSIENEMRHPSVDRHVSNVIETIEDSLFGQAHPPTVSKAVYLGGPSHGEISGGDYSIGESEIVLGPKPIWWDWSKKFEHLYRPTGNVACGMLVYEHVGESHPGS